ncbi:MAG TPA: LytTR family DNA-binding domain-containing protein, partial [Clostridia bacterium]
MSIILIVEDNYKQAEYLKKNLSVSSDDIKIITAYNYKQAFEYALKYKIDLFILDIELPDISGLKLAEDIRSLPEYKFAWIIFLTAYGQYLPEALTKTHCYDFITKPYDVVKLREMVNELVKSKIISKVDIPSVYFSINCRDIYFTININKIIFVEVNQKVCSIHTYFDKYDINRYSLKKAYSQLPTQKFVQCHKSIIINIDYIDH